MRNALAILVFLREAIARGERCVLVTLTDVVGGSARGPGAHMAVTQSGASLGSFSGGCVEAAVVGEALAALHQGRADLVRFGAGSRYIDIRLPCGGGIDLLFTPDPDPLALDRMIARLESRHSLAMTLGRDGSITLGRGDATGWRGAVFTAIHEPDPRLMIVGHGAETIALARLARSYTDQVCILTPDMDVAEQAAALGIGCDGLLTPRSVGGLTADPHSAVLFLFHDHDWETELLLAALATPAFFIGAMGSPATHARRCATLRERGVSARDIARITGPVGLIPASRDPETLAVSILAQVVERFGDRGRRAAPREEPLSVVSRSHQIMRL